MLDTSNPRSKNTGRRTQTRCDCDGCATSSDRATLICNCEKQHIVAPASFGFLEFACPVGTSQEGPSRYLAVLKH